MLSPSAIPWNAYPAMLLAAVFAAGVWIGTHVQGGPLFAVSAAAGVAVSVSALVLGRRHLISLHPTLWFLGVILATAGTGAFHAHQCARQGSDDIGLLIANVPALSEAPTVKASGFLDGFPQETVYGPRFTMRIRELEYGGKTIPASGRVQVSLRRPRGNAAFAGHPVLELGDRVEVTGRLRPLPGRRNPGDFDYGAYLLRRGITAVMVTYDATPVRLTGAESSWKRALIVPLRRHVANAIAIHVNDQASRAVLRALLVGDRTGIDPEIRDKFARTGLMHLLAVSGLHVLLVGMVIYVLLKPFLLRLGLSWWGSEVTRALITLAILLIYVFISGAPPSAVRAVTMAVVLIAGGLLQRSGSALNSLGVAAVVLLVAQPSQLFDVGFQLSFAAVTAIICLKPVFESWIPRRWLARPMIKKPIELTLVSLAATLGTMPVVLYHFGRLPFAGILLNLAAIPITFLLLAAGLLLSAFHTWMAPVAAAYGASADVLAQALLHTARFGHEWFSWTLVRGYVRQGYAILALTALLVALTHWHRPRVRWRFLIMCAAGITAGLWWHSLGGRSLDVIFLDVGQGDAAIVRLPNGRHILIDAGIRDFYNDSGRRVLVPHLERFNIAGLEAVIISHPHADHMGGLPHLLRTIPVKSVYHSGQPYNSALFAEKVHLIDSLGVHTMNLTAGEKLHLAPGVDLRVLYPDAPPDHHRDANNYSVVLRLQYGNTSFLFSGDAEVRAERAVTDAFFDVLRSTVVKVGHHGSATSSTEPFVHAVCGDLGYTRFAIVSVGERNRYGHPSPDVLERWKRCGAEVLKTRREGAVWLRSNGISVQRVQWRR